MQQNPAKTPLAIDGGPACVPQGPPTWPPPDEAIHAALQSAWADGSWATYEGPHGRQLTEAMQAMLGVEHVLLCSSGTVGVQAALAGLNIGAGDEVILAGYDYPGNFRAIESLQARPVVVDVAPENWNLDPQQAIDAVSPLTRAIVVSHLHGSVVLMRGLVDAAHGRGIAVVEDACQAVGATIQGRPAGIWGDVGVWSFGGGKLLSAGRGGAMFTNRADIHQRARVFCHPASNAYPLSELQAAVLLPQLARLPDRHQARAAGARHLAAALANCAAVRPLPTPPDADPAYYKFALRYDAAATNGRTRDEFVAAVRAEGVALGGGFPGFHRRSEQRCRRAGPLSVSQAAAERIVLLHHPVLMESPDTLARVAGAISKVSNSFAEL